MRRRPLSIAVLVLLTTAAVVASVVASAGAATKAVLHTRAPRVPVVVSCPAATAGPGCRIKVELWASAPFSGGQLLVGRMTASVSAGQQRQVMVWLTARGRALERRHAPLALTVRTFVSVPNPAPQPPPAAPAPPTMTVPAPPPCHVTGPPVAILPGTIQSGIALEAGPNCMQPLG